MSSFLDRLKKKHVIPETADSLKQEQVQAQAQAPAQRDSVSDDERLRVDIYKAPDAIIIHAQVGGAHIDSYDVIVEGDDDVIVIEGQRVLFSVEGKEKILEECTWGKFYRQIILPSQIDPEKTQAVISDGVLMLHLPHRGKVSSGIHVHVNKV
jgi:HSP20 family molecular chaperone IbpA